MHKELISKIIENGTPADMVCLKNILIELIDVLKQNDIDKYKEIEFKLYKIVYGEHLNESLARCWVNSMVNKDGTVGEHWSLEQTTKYADSFNKYDFYAVLNMLYSDYYNPRFDESVYIELAKDWLKDPDVPNNKTLKYYMLIARK